jgi:hypothetical protein
MPVTSALRITSSSLIVLLSFSRLTRTWFALCNRSIPGSIRESGVFGFAAGAEDFSRARSAEASFLPSAPEAGGAPGVATGKPANDHILKNKNPGTRSRVSGIAVTSQ